MAERAIKEPLDYITTIATLLHDVSEDVILDKFKNKKDWLDYIEKYFQQTQKGKLIREIIEGVTQVKLPKNKLLRKEIKESPLGKFFFAVAEKGGIKSKNHTQMEVRAINSKDEESLLKTLYNLELSLKSALKSPDHLRIILVKLLDIWSNFNSPDYISQVKKLRVFVAKSLAYYFGWDALGNGEEC